MTYNIGAKFTDLKGKTLQSIVNNDSYELIFTTIEGDKYKMYHEQDCCESVYIESIVGDLDDLVGNEILLAEEVSLADEPPHIDWDESYTWTFYKLATIKGYVTIRWFGYSNGYYSEAVDFCLMSEKV